MIAIEAWTDCRKTLPLWYKLSKKCVLIYGEFKGNGKPKNSKYAGKTKCYIN